MKLFVGLGNPGLKYENTRHNAGFMVIDTLLDKLGLRLDQSGFKGEYTSFRHKGEKIIILKPMTYMNLSGESVKACLDYYKMSKDDLIVVHDDLDLPIGKLRLRARGSSGGQKGMGNIIDLLHTSDIKRIRLGIDKNPLIPTVDYVLGKFTKEEEEAFSNGKKRAAEALVALLDEDFEKVMNTFNR